MFEQHVSRLGRELRRQDAIAANARRDAQRRDAAAERRWQMRELQRAIGGFAQVPFLDGQVVSTANPVDFDLNTVPGILWWFDSENVTTTTIGPDVFVDSLLDRSAVTGPALKDSDPTRPKVTFGNPQFNGAATLSWSNADLTCMRAPVVNIGPYTMTIVARITTPTTYLWASNDNYLYGSVGYSYFSGVRDGTGSLSRNNPGGSGWADVGAPITVSIRMGGTASSLSIRVNGVEQMWNVGLNDDPGTAHVNTYITLLSYIDGSASSDGEFGTAALWDNAISDANLNKVEARFRGYYQHY